MAFGSPGLASRGSALRDRVGGGRWRRRRWRAVARVEVTRSAVRCEQGSSGLGLGGVEGRSKVLVGDSTFPFHVDRFEQVCHTTHSK